MEIVLLDSETLGDDISLKPIEKFGNLKVYKRTSKFETLERVKNADIVITNKVVIDKEIIENSQKLKLICVAATGMNNIDLESAKSNGIFVKNVAGYSTDSVVQHTFTILFYLIGSSRYYDDYVKSKKWSKSGLFTHLEKPFFEIKGKKWGIIGLGTIGKSVADVASAFGAEICYYSTNKKPHSDKYPHKNLEELLKTSDIVSIHAPLNENTKNLIGKNELNLLKDRAILLNLGRGGIVDESELASKIDSSNILVGLDVTSSEPLPETSPLLNIKIEIDSLLLRHCLGKCRGEREIDSWNCKHIEEF